MLRSRMVAIEQVTIASSAGAGGVAVSFIGGSAGDVLTEPCATDYELDVDEEVNPPTVTVWQLVPTVLPVPAGGGDFVCTAEGHWRELQYEWSGAAPLEVLDGFNGEMLAVLSLTGLLVPEVLPAGGSIGPSDAPPAPLGSTTRLTDGTSTVVLYTTLHRDPLSELETIRTGPEFDQIVIRADTSAETSTFEGRPQLRFVDGNYLYQLSADQEVPPAVLVAIADGLR